MKLDNVELIQHDMLKMPFTDTSFDIVWAWGSAHHTEDPWLPLAKTMAFFSWPLVALRQLFKQKSRKGEKLSELILDWYFVPIRFYFTPEKIRRHLEEKGYEIEKFLPASGRFKSASNFIFKARKAA